MIIQIILVAFVAYILTRVYSRYKAQDITRQEFAIWILFWLLVGIVIVIPQQTDRIAQFLGVSRGADLLVYISIIAIFFSLFKLKVSVVTLNKDVTKLAKKIALDNPRKPHEPEKQ